MIKITFVLLEQKVIFDLISKTLINSDTILCVRAVVLAYLKLPVSVIIPVYMHSAIDLSIWQLSFMVFIISYTSWAVEHAFGSLKIRSAIPISGS